MAAEKKEEEIIGERKKKLNEKIVLKVGLKGLFKAGATTNEEPYDIIHFFMEYLFNSLFISHSLSLFLFPSLYLSLFIFFLSDYCLFAFQYSYICIPVSYLLVFAKVPDCTNCIYNTYVKHFASYNLSWLLDLFPLFSNRPLYTYVHLDIKIPIFRHNKY